ncbi:MAG: DUF3991 and toprim domain-containing protein [Treponema sp.]|nr:DUF3991 and toprim domain-containing protein [Treponema sp.]
MEREIIQRARQANLPEYLMSVGVPLIKSGNHRYKHAEHDSLLFTDNAYFWNSIQDRGNAIDYLTKHMGMNFKEAVTALTNVKPAEPRAVRAFEWGDISVYRSPDSVVRYLDKTRRINLCIVEWLLRHKLLFQEERTNNAVFPMYDENNNIVGAEFRGITNKPFKGVAGGSKYGYGFNVRFADDNNFDYALFFESPIDLLSYIDYKIYHKDEKFKRCILISMAGVKINILKHGLKTFAPNAKAILCVDNDTAGQNFINLVNSAGIDYALRLPDEKYKDWNEQITNMKRYCNPVGRMLERARNSLSLEL